MEMEIFRGLKIPLRDGIELNATIYRAKEPARAPAILTVTPYLADSCHASAVYFAQRGYVFAAVDCRGRGNSGGTFEPFMHEGCDGYDVVEWLAAQPWCSGAVAMWGGSYSGFNQWMTLKEAPPHLRTIVPVASPHQGVDFPFRGGIFYSYAIRWLTLTSGASGNDNLFADCSFWATKFREHFLAHRSFRELDRIIGNSDTYFRTWLEHPAPDSYWDRLMLSPRDYDRIAVPILTITGQYDCTQPGAMHYYRHHMRSGSSARDRHFLVLGPWNHAGTRAPAENVGGLDLGEESLVDMHELHREWYDWVLKGGPRPAFLRDRVTYYLCGATRWKNADSLEAIGATAIRLYLDSTNGEANHVFHSGTLAETPPAASSADHYAYDPLDVGPAELENEEAGDDPTDQRIALNLRNDGLVYHSAPFSRDTELTGHVKFVAWIAIDTPDTDFQITLSEILPDGLHVRLTTDMLRARYRESLRKETLATPGEINRYEFSGFSFISRLIAKGSRLRLVISSPNSIHLQKNYNSGGSVAGESIKDAKTVRVTLFHDADHSSYIELPLVGHCRS